MAERRCFFHSYNSSGPRRVGFQAKLSRIYNQAWLCCLPGSPSNPTNFHEWFISTWYFVFSSSRYLSLFYFPLFIRGGKGRGKSVTRKVSATYIIHTIPTRDFPPISSPVWWEKINNNKTDGLNCVCTRQSHAYTHVRILTVAKC